MTIMQLPDEDSVEAALDASGQTWVRRDDSWAVPVFPGLPRDLIIRRVPGGVSVTATLIEWEPEGLEPVSGEALAEFMLQAQLGLRFARCELDPRSARVVSRADTESLETDLAHSLLGVIAGCRTLAREARAVLVPDVARTYLEVRRDACPQRE